MCIRDRANPVKGIIRRATPEDTAIYEANREKSREAFRICHQKIQEHELPMKLIEVDYTFDGNKVIFYFTSEGRVDFRELVKDLACLLYTSWQALSLTWTIRYCVLRSILTG